MAYARFGDDSDVYVYAYGIGIFVLGIAEQRLKPNWSTSKYTYEQICNGEDAVKIDLPFAGEFFNFYNLEDLRDKLHDLKELGYMVPEYCLERIDRELYDIKELGDK